MTDDVAGDSTTGDLSYRELGPEDFAEGGEYYEATVPTRELSVAVKALLEEGHLSEEKENEVKKRLLGEQLGQPE